MRRRLGTFADLIAGMTDCFIEFRVPEDTTSGGREFQSLIVLGKKEYVKY